MKRFFAISVLILLFFATSAQIPAGYYDGTDGLSGDDLRMTLRSIATSGQQNNSYDALYGYYESTDNFGSNKVWDMYSMDNEGNAAYYFYFNGNDECGSYSDEGDCFNREHSVPESWMGSGGSIADADLFVVVPSDGKVNGMRSNLPYGETSSPNWISTNGSKRGSCTYPGYTGTIFEPIDAYKGDFARAYFYVVTRYNVSDWGGDSFSGDGFSSWTLNMLLEWNALDPISQKEIDRNNAVYSIQHNRNPYIDYPEWVCEVFGGNCGTTVEPANNLVALGVSTTQIDLSWNLNTAQNNIVMAYNTSNTFGTPSGTYLPGETISSGGTVLATGNTINFSHSGLLPQTYYYKIWSFDGAEYSSGVSVSASPLMPEPSAHVTNFTPLNISSSSVDVSWTDATGGVLPSGYIIKANYAGSEILPPVDGQPENDGVFTKNVSYGDQIVTFDNLTPTTQFDFVIYPYTNSSTNIDYKTDGDIPQTTALTTLVPEFCGNETFDLMSTGSSTYSTVNWTGQDGSSWTATDSRTDQSITGPAICVRDGYMESGSLQNGISEITVSTKRAFTGGSGVLSVFVNSQKVGEIPYGDLLETTTLYGIDISGEIVLRFETPGVGDRVVIDDIVWKCFGSSSAVDYDSHVQAPGVQIPENTVLFSELNYIDVFALKLTDKGTSDGLSTFISSIKIFPKLPENTADFTNTVNSIKVSDGTSDITLSTVSITDGFINIPFLSAYEIADNSSVEFTVSVLLNNNQIFDDCVLAIMIDADNHGFTAQETGSGFASVFASDIVSNNLNISVPCTVPETNASNIIFSGIDMNSVSVNWAQGSGQNRIMIAKEGSAVDAIPADGNSYAADSNFGSGSEISSGNFVVYNSNSNSISITGLSENSTYFFKIFEYNCEPGAEMYYIDGAVAESSVSTLASAVHNINSSVYIYPNPAKNIVNISLSVVYDYATLNVYDFSGRLVMKNNLKGTNESINISQLAKGLYFVEILIDQDVIRQKIIVE